MRPAAGTRCTNCSMIIQPGEGASSPNGWDFHHAPYHCTRALGAAIMRLEERLTTLEGGGNGPIFGALIRSLQPDPTQAERMAVAALALGLCRLCHQPLVCQCERAEVVG